MRGRKQQFAYSGRKRCIFLVKNYLLKKFQLIAKIPTIFTVFFTETKISRDNKALFFGFLREY